RNSGVCGIFGAVRDSKNMISNRSLNTGIVTFINFKQDVPARVSQLTFAHEVGHNFGAPHDTTATCAPYGTSEPNAASGNYIMFPSATQGNMPNNAKFSSCSISAITKVLETLEPNGKRKNCFQSSGNAFCGNGVVEGIEECDCGYQEQCSDQCCNPKIDSNNSSCTLRSGVTCSPSQGPCCSSNCDKTLCNSYSKTCLEGECIDSVCSNISWTECFITQAQGATEESMCYVSCKKNESSECVSSIDTTKVKAYPEFKDLLEKIKTLSKSTTIGLKRPAGSPCNDFKGYCDGFSKCRKVDAEGPFKQLTDLIFSPVTLSNIRAWIEEYWWAVLLMSVGVVVFMGVFIKVFGYNTPSKNPKKKTTTRPQGAAQRDVNRQRRPKPDSNKGSTVFSTDLPMYSQPSSSQKTSSQVTRSTDLPMYSQPSSSQKTSSQVTRSTDLPMYSKASPYSDSQSTHDYHSLDLNDGKNGYDNYAFQGPSNQKRHQQFDRIAAPRNFFKDNCEVPECVLDLVHFTSASLVIVAVINV
ncbi:Disintegrin and metalloproteinase domain-containing protein 10, partial [Bulinus truncatus]